MAKKTTRQESSDRLFATFFFALIQAALQKWRNLNAREAGEAMKSLLENGVRNFFEELLSSSRSSSAEDALKRLFGFMDSYPYTHEAVAHSISKSPQEVMKMEEDFFSKGAEVTTTLIKQMRTDWLDSHPCSDCRVKAGVVHRIGCRLEECPFCHEVLSKCFCAYKQLKIGWGGRSSKEWRQMEKQSGQKWTEEQRKPHIKPLTPEQERQWAALVLKKGCIPYGSEKRFQ